jgi:hypothetical protein
VISALTPEDLRRFVACQSERYNTLGNATSMISALRGYFSFRTTCGPVRRGGPGDEQSGSGSTSGAWNGTGKVPAADALMQFLQDL